MNASLISIGQELLIGDTINTNAAWIGSLLSENGIVCKRVDTIGDDADQINRSIALALESSDLVIMTGGLGPTHDDVTKKVLSDFFGSPLVRHQPSYEHIKSIFERRGIEFSRSNHAQADVLSDCDVLFNKAGTAPGMWISHQNKIVIALPGVPSEMKYLMTHEVMPRLILQNGGNAGYYAHYFQVAGIGESTLSDQHIGDLSHLLTDRLTLAYLPHKHGITLRVSSYARDADIAREQAAELITTLRQRAGEFIYSEVYAESLESAVIRLLMAQNKVVATAESCSGGQLSHFLTNVSGSSQVFNGGIVAYSNDMKSKLLGIADEVIAAHGAVSKEVALQMAKSVAEVFGADFGLSTTGVAGPGGGTPDKPVGTVWIGFWSKSDHFAVQARLFNDRLLNKERSAVIALDLLRRHLENIPTLPYQLKRDTR